MLRCRNFFYTRSDPAAAPSLIDQAADLLQNLRLFLRYDALSKDYDDAPLFSPQNPFYVTEHQKASQQNNNYCNNMLSCHLLYCSRR